MAKVKHFLPKGLVPVKNVGLGKSPSEDLVNVPFSVKGVFPSVDKNGQERTWVPMVATGSKLNHQFMLEADVLAGLDQSPVIEVEGNLGIDEGMKLTWTSGMREPSFK